MRRPRFRPLFWFTLLAATVALVSNTEARPKEDGTTLDHLRFVNLDRGTDAVRSLKSTAFGTALQGTTFFGGTYWAADSARWEALADSVWTFDTGVGSDYDFSDPDVNPFKQQFLHAHMEGWIGFDNSYSDLPYFRRLGVGDFPGTPCVGSAAGLGGNYSFWAGALPAEADQLCYAAGQGYGNSWNICIGHTFPYPGSGSVSLDFDYVNETEPGYDFTYVIVDTSGAGDDVPADAYTGAVSGHTTLNLSQGEALPGSAGDILIKFCVSSDVAWSDEDGFNPTVCGAFAVDNIVIGGALSHSADFETGDDGWTRLQATAGLGGEWSNIAAVSDLPGTLTPCTCALNDSVLVFENALATGHGLYQDNLAASPWIDLKAAGLDGTPGKILSYDVYTELPLLNYIFSQSQVQWYPQVCPQTGKLVTSPFTSTGFVGFYGNIPICTNAATGSIVDNFGSIIDTGAEQVRVAVGVISYCRFYAACTGASNSTPWFDNIKLGVFGDPDAPFLTTRTIDVPQDAFPENGTLRSDAPGRIDCNEVKGFASPEIGSSLGDTLIVLGGSANAEVYVQFAVDPGPGVDPGNLAAFLSKVTFVETRNGQDWYSARMDTAEQAGTVSPGTYMTAFHEDDPAFSGSDTDRDPNDLDPNGGMNRLANDIFPDDLFTPGSRLNLFYKARYVGGSIWFTNPDTTGGVYLEAEILPSSYAADSTFNCVLYVDHFDGRGAQPFIESALGAVLGGGSANFENTPWDRYDVRAPDSQQGSLGRPLNSEYGATLIQLLGYKAIIWSTGNLDAFNLVKEDADILVPWLTLVDFGFNNLYLTGNDIAASMSRESGSEPSARILLEDLLGVIWGCDTFRELDCPPGSPQTLQACVGLDPVSGAVVSTRPLGTAPVAQGNGCPQLRSFDVLAVNPAPSFGTAAGEEEYSAVSPAKTAQYASVSNDATGGPIYRSVVDGVSIHYRRDAADCVFNPAVGSDVAQVEERMLEVMTYFGYTGSPDACDDVTVGTGVGNDPRRETFRTGLANFAPNPLLGGENGRIRFTMSKRGQAMIEVFDVNGRLVNRVFEGVAAEGPNEVTWNGRDASGRLVSSGVYFYRLRAEGENFSKKLVVVRNGG